MNILNLFPSYRKLVEDNKQLSKDFFDLADAELTIYDIAVRNGVITAEFGTEAARVMAEQFHELLKENKARNYVELRLHEKTEKNDDINIIVTIRWNEGKTPHELRIEAERERDELKLKLSQAEEKIALLQKL